MAEKDASIPPPADEYEPLTADNFDAAIEVFKKDGDAYINTDKPDKFEDALDLYVKKAAAGGDEAAAAAQSPDEAAATSTLDPMMVIQQGIALEALKDKLTREQIKEKIKANFPSISDVDLNTMVAAVEAQGDNQNGGRRRTKRKGRKGIRKSRKGAKKGAKKSRKGAKKSQNGGRRSSKNRRKHSHRRKH
jgi:hypothetical protein